MRRGRGYPCFIVSDTQRQESRVSVAPFQEAGPGDLQTQLPERFRKGVLVEAPSTEPQRVFLRNTGSSLGKP